MSLDLHNTELFLGFWQYHHESWPAQYRTTDSSSLTLDVIAHIDNVIINMIIGSEQILVQTYMISNPQSKTQLEALLLWEAASKVPPYDFVSTKAALSKIRDSFFLFFLLNFNLQHSEILCFGFMTIANRFPTSLN